MIKNEQLLVIYRNMLLAREFDNEIFRLYRQGKIFGGAYPGVGNEATSVASAMALEKDDVIFPMHRDIGVHFVRGQSAKQLFINHLAREGANSRGVDGTGHYADASKNIYGNVSHLGAMIPVAVGVALAAKLEKEKIVVMNYIGDGGAQTGEFHEGVNFAAVQKLPFVLIIENNQYAYSTPNTVEFAAKKLSDRAAGYGCFGETVDGTDVEKVYAASQRAIKRAREGKGPTLIESITMRMRGHAEHDDASYVPKKTLAAWEKKDPLALCEKLLLKKKVATQKSIDALKKEIEHEIRETAEYALGLPPIQPDDSLLNVFAE
ncbi:MAG TPA: thiamine pyrophosphate-dependent dehydrogenase E1 component subunit alpha [Candidatus Kapabacteria bacterium]|nr:thiamine pyrophosphate-dependent dehydrogenase E1 component subunit alpha [Candidatus Kapabacteria bacterium]